MLCCWPNPPLQRQPNEGLRHIPPISPRAAVRSPGVQVQLAADSNAREPAKPANFSTLNHAGWETIQPYGRD